MSTGFISSASSQQIADVFACHVPWITGFRINGHHHGGDYVPAEDPRVLEFIATVKSAGVEPRALLECGCLEGGHTLTLAHAFPNTTICAVDVRAGNLAKAKAAAELLGVKNIHFVAEDFDGPCDCLGRSYDAIFCVGLLYHLSNPRDFLKRACAASPALWLWTIYCADDEAISVDHGGRGRPLAERVEHPLAAVRPASYLPTIGALCDFLWEAGYTSVRLVRKEITTNGNGPAILLSASR